MYFTSIGVIIAVCILFGISLNVGVVYFFSTQVLTFARQFTVVACLDISICFQASFILISILTRESDAIFTNDIFCQTWGFFWRLSSAFSAHLVTIIGILRTIKILFPLSNKPDRSIMIIFVDFICLVLIYVMPLAIGQRFAHEVSIGYCIPLFAAAEVPRFSITSIISTFVPGMILLLTLPIILVCFTMCTYSLVIKRLRRSSVRPYHLQSALTITSCMFAYIVCNLPLLVFICFVIVKLRVTGQHISELMSDSDMLYSLGTINLVPVLSNSLANPLIYIWRFQSLRTFLYRLVCSIFQMFMAKQNNDISDKRNLVVLHNLGHCHQPLQECDMNEKNQRNAVVAKICDEIRHINESDTEDNFLLLDDELVSLRFSKRQCNATSTFHLMEMESTI